MSTEDDKPVDRIEMWTAAVLGLATILSAWIGFQASTWSSSMSTNYAQAGRFHREALKVDNRIGQQAIIDRSAFDRWTEASAHKDIALTGTIQRRFSPQLAKCFGEWQVQGSPVEVTPLDLPDYAEPSAQEAALEQNASDANARAEYANKVHDQYIMFEIGTATALFFLGLSSLGKGGRLRMAYVSVGTLVFGAVAIVAIAWPKRF
jgi:hypothetical protein